MAIRRTQGRDGRLYYFQNGRRVPESTGSRQFVRENYDLLSSGQIRPLTARETRSFSASTRARERYRLDGRFVSNPFGILNILESTGRIPAVQRNLNLVFPREQIIRIFDSTYTTDFSTFRQHVGSGEFDNYRNRRGQLMDVVDEVRDYMRRGYSLEVTDRNGNVTSGNAALDAVRQFEADQQQSFVESRGNELENVEFFHRVSINPYQRTIKINLNETDVIPRGGTP